RLVSIDCGVLMNAVAQFRQQRLCLRIGNREGAYLSFTLNHANVAFDDSGVCPAFSIARRRLRFIDSHLPPIYASSISMVPVSFSKESSSIANRMRCSINQAVRCVTCRARPSSCEEIPLRLL